MKELEYQTDSYEGKQTVPGGSIFSGLNVYRMNLQRCLITLFCMAVFSFSARADTPGDSICINGVWEFCAAGTSAESPPATGWRPVRVPDSWGTSGATCFAFTTNELSSPQAWYRKKFFVPSVWAEKSRVKIRFGAIVDGYRILVNGKTVAASKILGLCLDVDITDNVRFGEDNLLEVMTSKFIDVTENTKKKIGITDAGITRDVYLCRVPLEHVKWSHVVTSVRKKSISVRTLVVNDGPETTTATVTAEVLDNGRKILSLPARSVQIAAGGNATVETSAPWHDPILWGFGEYGSPHLYTLRARLQSGDARDDRFGFREFRISGEQFLLNEKPIFLKGDLLSRRNLFTENHAYATAYYQRLRDSGMNFQRMHSWYSSTFEDPAWYDAADETGMLVEAQLHALATGGRRIPADDPVNFEVWTAYINECFNHPSLVFWSIDNESFSVPAKDIPAIPEEKIKAFNRLAAYVRELDPTRVMEIHHNWALFPSVKKGVFARENFTTFNIHPYGKIGAEILKSQSVVNFDRSVPAVVGEIYTFPKDLDFINSPIIAYIEQNRKAHSYAQQILDAQSVPGVADIVLCSLVADGWIGFSDSKSFQLGPWTDYAVISDATGAPLGRREFKVDVAWPSLSGTGVKAEFIGGYNVYWATGTGLNLNWFDPSRPMFLRNIINDKVRETFARLPGGAAVPIGPERAAEIVVGFGVNGKPVENVYVTLAGGENQARLDGVATDSSGTAWFRVWDTGKYLARCEWKGRTWEKTFFIDKRPCMDGHAGYGYIQWVNLGDIDLKETIGALKKPAVFRDSYDVMRGDIVANGGMEAWGKDGVLFWNGTAERATSAHSGYAGARLAGPAGRITAPLRMENGHDYTVSGWVISKDGSAGLRVLDNKYQTITSVSSRPESGWQELKATFTANGPGYLYAEVRGRAGSEGFFDDLKVCATGKTTDVFNPGPYAVSPGGFIRNWLRLGPFPSRSTANGSYEGFVTDWLASVGGEPSYQAAFGKKVNVHFSPSNFWVEGNAALSWKQLDSAVDNVNLNSIGLPELGISNNPGHVCCYLACLVLSPEDRNGEIAIGSDDGYRIWLNGKEVGALSVTRGSKPDQEAYPVRLKRGENMLLVKIFQDVGGWNCFLRFRDSNKIAMTDLKVLLPGETDGVRCLTPDGGSRPVLLSDGNTLIYEIIDEKGNMTIRKRDMQNGTEHKLVEGFNPFPAAGGQHLLCLRGSLGSQELYQVKIADVKTTAVPVSPRVTRLCSRFPDGRILAMTGKGLHVLSTADGKFSISAWPSGAGADDAAISRDGKLAALVMPDAGGIPYIRVMNLATGRELLRPLRMDVTGASRIGGCHSPAFSQDGRYLVFVRAGIQPNADIWLLELATGRETAITKDGARNSFPAFSPDSRSVLFSATRDGDQEKVWEIPLFVQKKE